MRTFNESENIDILCGRKRNSGEDENARNSQQSQEKPKESLWKRFKAKVKAVYEIVKPLLETMTAIVLSVGGLISAFSNLKKASQKEGRACHA